MAHPDHDGNAAAQAFDKFIDIPTPETGGRRLSKGNGLHASAIRPVHPQSRLVPVNCDCQLSRQCCRHSHFLIDDSIPIDQIDMRLCDIEERANHAYSP